MKFTKLIIQNIGKIPDAQIPIEKPLNVFYGEVKEGKSTILNAVKLCYGGAFPPDILRHGALDGLVRLEFVGGYIERQFYVRDGVTEARPVVFVRDGKPVNAPVDELRRLLNPFERDQNHFIKMGVPERQRFFCDLLGVDTGEIDAEAHDLKEQNTNLETKVLQYGEIDLTPVEAPDPIGLRKMKSERTADYNAQVKRIKADHAAKVNGWNKELDGLREAVEGGKRKELRDAEENNEALLKRHKAAQSDVVRLKAELQLAEVECQNLAASLLESETVCSDLEAEVACLPDLTNEIAALQAKIAEPLELPAFNTDDLDAKLEAAAAQAVRYQTFLDNQARAQQRDGHASLIEINKERLKELKQLKAAKLAEIAEASGIPQLAFDEDGNFVFEGTSAGMLSTSQLIRLSQRLSNLYPPGVDLSLIDRAESLGKDVLLLVEEAKANNRTYLATVVGQRPAKVPEDVGVFIVQDGRVSQ